MDFILNIALGVVIGLLLARIFRPKPVGYLRMDHSDPDDEPYLFLELEEEPSTLFKRKEVVLLTKIEDFIPRK